MSTDKAIHTPGPWEFRADGGWTIFAGGDSIMGNETYYPWVPEKKADWVLIAAAPDMLAALKAVDDFISGKPDAVEPFGIVRAAIAKAEQP